MKGAAPSNAAALLNRVEALLKHVRKGEAPLTSKPMAEVLGMTWENLRKTYILGHPDFPVAEHGGQGRNYLFDVRDVLLWMQKHLKAKLHNEVEEAHRISHLTGIAIADASAPTQVAGLADLGLLLRIARDVEDMKTRQGQMVPRATVDTFIQEYHGIFMSEILGSAGMADPTGQWPVEIRALWDARMKSLAMKLQRRVDEEMSLSDADPASVTGPVANGIGGPGTRRVRGKPSRSGRKKAA